MSTIKALLNEAIKTQCQTPEMIYNIKISDKAIDINLRLPDKLDLSDGDAKLLENNLHNALELVLARYFE